MTFYNIIFAFLSRRFNNSSQRYSYLAPKRY